MAFPVQVNLGHIAAHYCAEPNDEITFKDEVICMDVGAHYNGAIGDNALSVDLSGKYYGMDNLYISDGSIFPTSVAANPMESILAFSAKITSGINL